MFMAIAFNCTRTMAICRACARLERAIGNYEVMLTAATELHILVLTCMHYYNNAHHIIVYGERCLSTECLRHDITPVFHH